MVLGFGVYAVWWWLDYTVKLLKSADIIAAMFRPRTHQYRVTIQSQTSLARLITFKYSTCLKEKNLWDLRRESNPGRLNYMWKALLLVYRWSVFDSNFVCMTVCIDVDNNTPLIIFFHFQKKLSAFCRVLYKTLQRSTYREKNNKLTCCLEKHSEVIRIFTIFAAAVVTLGWFRRQDTVLPRSGLPQVKLSPSTWVPHATVWKDIAMYGLC